MSAVNDIAIIVEHLAKTGTALYTLCGARVYYGLLPSDFLNTQPALVLSRRGGQPDEYNGTFEGDYQIKCYGGTASFAEAENVYRALRDVLHGNANTNQETASGAVVTATETTAGQPLKDPDTGWLYVLTFYTVAVRPS